MKNCTFRDESNSGKRSENMRKPKDFPRLQSAELPGNREGNDPNGEEINHCHRHGGDHGDPPPETQTSLSTRFSTRFCVQNLNSCTFKQHLGMDMTAKGSLCVCGPLVLSGQRSKTATSETASSDCSCHYGRHLIRRKPRIGVPGRGHRSQWLDHSPGCSPVVNYYRS